jgi:hypothetical protein
MNNRNNQLHAFHLVDLSLWPILLRFSYHHLILTFVLFLISTDIPEIFFYSLCVYLRF